MSDFDRAAHCRAIASKGGRTTVERHGSDHMARIGAAGFRAAVDLGWGLELARKLAPSYAAKFGKPLQLGPAAREKAAARARARALYSGMICDVPGCTQPGQVHHIQGFAVDGDPNAGTNIAIRCAAHHRALHQAQRRAHLRHAS